MAGYSGGMSEAAATFRATDPVEARLRGALDQGDVVLSTVAPVLRHLLASDDSGLFGDAILARVRGMTGDVARQLLAHVDGAHADPAAMTLALTANPAFLGHVHALVLEWHLTELLQARLAIDPVLSPLLQALIASSDETTAGLAMKFLAAQARFGQAQRRMRLAVTELPGDLLRVAGVVNGAGEAGSQDRFIQHLLFDVDVRKEAVVAVLAATVEPQFDKPVVEKFAREIGSFLAPWLDRMIRLDRFRRVDADQTHAGMTKRR